MEGNKSLPVENKEKVDRALHFSSKDVSAMLIAVTLCWKGAGMRGWVGWVGEGSPAYA